MNKLDYKTLDILKKNGRGIASDTSKTVRLSVSTVLDRIKKMEESDIIKGCTVRVDVRALGNGVTVLMEISLEHSGPRDSFTEMIMDHPNILDCRYLTGDYDFVLKISCASFDELERTHRTIKSIPGVPATRTYFVLRKIRSMYPAISEEEEKRFQHHVSMNVLL